MNGRAAYAPRRMHQFRSLAAGALLALLASAVAGIALGLGPPYPAPVEDQAVYDAADLLSPGVEAALEERIDTIEARSGAEIVIYTEPNTDITEDENLANARLLMDQWGVGRAGFDDGLVILIAKDPDVGETRISTFAGAGFLRAYANEEALSLIREGDLVPYARVGDWDGATLETIDALDARVTPQATQTLDTLRTLNAVLGLVGAPVVLAVTLGFAWWRWRREGDDPELVDSPSILMAGPPAEMTPPLATVIRTGRATQHSLNTTLLELAGAGRISFENLDQVASARSDDPPDPLTDPAIVVHRDSERDVLERPESLAWDAIRRLGGSDGRLTRQSLWRLNDSLSRVGRALEQDAVRIGWLARMPGPLIGSMSTLGVIEAVLGGAAIFLGFTIPMSGATLLGIALVIGGLGTFVFGRAMSQRTKAGAYVDAMLTAYRRTLEKTLEQARSMREVIAEPTIQRLADTPDKAVVWGIALGLHAQVAEVLARGLADHRATGGRAGDPYYPAWLGSSASTSAGGWGASSTGSSGGIVAGGGSIFSGSGIPDIGGMFNALGSIGSTPASSSSSSSGGGGGFSGGGSSGGGGGSSSV
jgi:uncharacterized membrane protein YgcG